ncbi:MAG: ZIP family metal transporter [Deltaproteobacteria bacterium]|nr:ZIP family metal transporter [Deltaproteobacteria bacterium]
MSDFALKLSLYSILISASVFSGSLIPLTISWAKKQLPLLLAFSAGIMLGATLMHLLPEAYELMGRMAPFWVLAGFLFLYTFEKFVTVHICEALDCEVHTVGVTAVLGLSVHSLADGIALGSGLLVPQLGFVVFLTIFFHKLPEAFALTSILMHEGYRRSKILLLNLLLIVMVPVGALMVQGFAHSSGISFTGIALAFSAGTFLHISLSDLLPEVHKYETRRNSIFAGFLLGLILMFLLYRFLQA